ncbi:unnamed protein product [Mytilus coruscus]|uniref:Reverse transcriptase domain-containing protein n=1 Tax=Mytilus coruscus TaxID=42192 RepID=A0A6J8DN07_MYTCO|nr:unnamed protein product [Mytilus coruscus]
MIVLDTDLKPQYNKPKPREIYVYMKPKWEEIKADIIKLISDITNSNTSVEDKWTNLKIGIETTLNLNVPKKIKHKRHSLPWLSNNVKKKIRRKHKLFQKAKQTGKPEDRGKFKQHKRATQKAVRQAHWQYVNKILDPALEEEQVSDNPYLGVIISDNLKWSSHINKFCNKANSTLGFIRRNLKHCNKHFKETAYISLVRSVLDYSGTVWDPYQQKDINRIESIQRRAARFVCKDYRRTSSVASMMKHLGWKPLVERRREQRLVLLYKIVNDLVAIPTEHHIEFNTRPSRTSNVKQLKLLSANTDIYKHSFFPETIIDWNL